MKKIGYLLLLMLFLVPFNVSAEENINVIYDYAYNLYVNGTLHNENDNNTYNYSDSSGYIATYEELENSIGNYKVGLTNWLATKNSTYNERKMTREENVSEYFLRYELSEGAEITLNEGYEKQIDKVLHATVVNGTANVYIARTVSVTLNYEDTAAFDTVNEIVLNNVTTDLEIGKTPVFSGVSNSQDYELVSEAWYGFYGLGFYEFITDRAYSSYPEMAILRSEHLLNGVEYKYTFGVKVKNGASLSSNLSVVINGTTYNSIETAQNIENDFYIVRVNDLTVKKYDPAYDIDKVVITDASLNIVDQDNPEFTGKVNSDKYEIVLEKLEESTSSNKTTLAASDENYVNDLVNGSNSYYTYERLEKFDKNKNYNYSIVLVSKNGYVFKNTIELSLNGEVKTYTADANNHFYGTSVYLNNIKTITPVANLTYLVGDNTEYDLASNEDLLFKIDKDYSLFKGVVIDGVEIDSSYYTSNSDSTTIILSKDYLKTLTQTAHKITVLFTDNTKAITSFTIIDTTPSNVIEEIELENVNTDLEIGKTPVFSGKANNSNYELLSEAWYDSDGMYYIELISNDSYKEYDDSTNYVINDIEFSYSFNVKIKEGMNLSDNIKVVINGTTYNNIYVENNEEKGYYSIFVNDLKVKKYDSNYDISEVELNDVNFTLIDQEGVTFAGNTNSSKYDLKRETWEENQDDELKQVLITSDEEMMNSFLENNSPDFTYEKIEKFDKDKNYNYSVVINAKNGYSFKDTLKVVINGEEYIVTTDDNNTIYKTLIFLDKIKNVTPLQIPTYIIGEGAEYDLASEEGLLFEVDKDYKLFKGVTIDGETLSEEYYNSYSGSTVVVLNKAYLNSVDKGPHNISILFNDGTEAETTFTIVDNNTNSSVIDDVVDNQAEEQNITNPSTLDNITIYVTLFIVSMILLLSGTIYAYKYVFIKKN